MNAFPPLAVHFSAQRWSCVVDAPLALSRFGLMLTLRLAEEMNVWLVPGLWEILDSSEYYLSHPEHLGLGPWLEAAEVERERGSELAEAVDHWQVARCDANLPAIPLYWPRETARDSLLPKEVGAGLIRHFDCLAAGLEHRRSQRPRDPLAEQPILDCARDALALTAALGRHRAIVLTLGSRGGASEAPPLCRYLRESGIPCLPVEERPSDNPIRAHLAPLLARSGVIELLWAGLSVAVIHLVAPKAFLVPVDQGPEDLDGSFVSPMQTDESDDPNGWWEGAAAFWYRLG